MSCELCATRSGIHLVSRTCCAIRLLRATPKHGARQAMWHHLQRSLSIEQWEELRAAWRVDEPGTL